MQNWVSNCMLFWYFDCDLTHQVLFRYILPSYHVNWETSLEELKTHIFWCRTDICSCTLSARVSLVLENPCPAQSLCKLNYISVCFIQIITKIFCKQPIPFIPFLVTMISPIKGNQKIEFGQLIQNNKRNIFVSKSCRKWG